MAMPPPATRSAATRNLVRQVVEAIEKQILRGRLKPDQALPSAAELEQRYRVSRTVVREAMQILASRGLVRIIHGKRARVAQVDTGAAVQSLRTLIERQGSRLSELAEVRRPLESEMAALAARRADDQAIAAMEDAIARQARARQLSEQIEADLRFHELLAQASGNAVFAAMLEALSELLMASRERTIQNKGNKRAIAGHRLILRAIQAHDEDAARQAMLKHMDMALADLLESEAGDD